MLYISNSFSLSMLNSNKSESLTLNLKVKEIDISEVKEMLNNQWVSAVGHESTAKVMSQIVGIDIPYNRIQVKLEKNDKIIVFQLLTRLEEGKVLSDEELKALPHKWILVEVL
jgi:PIN domain nuclease of toxin-antitoxin system